MNTDNIDNRTDYRYAMRDQVNALRFQIISMIVIALAITLTITALVFDVPRWIAHVCIVFQFVLLAAGICVIPPVINRRRFILDELELNEEEQL
jgi:uncharacterized membrane protein YhdT